MTDEANISSTPNAADEKDAEAVIGIISDGAHSLIIARFPTIEEAQDAYAELTKLERTTSIRVEFGADCACRPRRQDPPGYGD